VLHAFKKGCTSFTLTGFQRTYFTTSLTLPNVTNNFNWQHGVWTQGLTFARQLLYHLSHSTSPSNFNCYRPIFFIFLTWSWVGVRIENFYAWIYGLYPKIKILIKLAIVAHAYNPGFSKDRELEDHGVRPTCTKCYETPSNPPKASVMWSVPIVPATH
jgi:hypothetical protein